MVSKNAFLWFKGMGKPVLPPVCTVLVADGPQASRKGSVDAAALSLSLNWRFFFIFFNN